MSLPDDITARLRPDSIAGQSEAGPMRHDVYVDATVVRTFRTQEDAGRLVWQIRQAIGQMRSGLAA